MGKPNEIETQPQDEIEIQFGADLHDLCVDAQRLEESGRLSPSLCFLLNELRRSIRGCRWCHQMLGDLHSWTCPTGGRRVIVFDLDLPEDKYQVKTEMTRPF